MYRPVFATDGSYTLTVQASDISRNQSGDNDYKVRFEVINKPTITEVLNYPNPFTTSTRFVFTVTGQQPPTYMKIQIMTISGRVVREVGLDELGPIRVGRNITEFAWDGTDAFGDRLGRGVYLYRVVAKLNGEEIEYRSTSAGGYFERGVGKMYLLR
jgi:flagellar hook assembly protein FlgD